MWNSFFPTGYLPYAPQLQHHRQPLPKGIASSSSLPSASATALSDNLPRVGALFNTTSIDDIRILHARLKEDSIMRRQVISKIIALAQDNLRYFTTVQQQNVKLLSTHDWVFSNLFVKQLDHLDEIGELVKKVEDVAVQYDPGPLTGCLPTNGYRSVLTATDACLERLHRLNERVKHKRDDLVFFRRAATQHELSDCTDILVTMRAFLVFCLQIDAAAEMYKMMPKYVSNPIEKAKQIQPQQQQQTSMQPADVQMYKPLILYQDQVYVDRWVNQIETIDQRCFYGRCAGFQYKQSVERIVTGFLIGMAAYADGIGASTLPQAVRDGSIKLTETIISQQHRARSRSPTSPDAKTSKDVPGGNAAEAEAELAALGQSVKHGSGLFSNSSPLKSSSAARSSLSAMTQGRNAEQQWQKSSSLDSSIVKRLDTPMGKSIPQSITAVPPVQQQHVAGSPPSSFFHNIFNGFGSAATGGATTTTTSAANSPPAPDGLSTSPTTTETTKRMGFFGASAVLANQLRSTTTSLLSTGKYIMQPDQRAEKICRVTRYGDINCIKGFWNIHENQLGYQLHDMVGPKIKTNNYFQIKHLPLKVRRRNKQTGADEYILVDPPSSHAPPRPIKVRLLCNYAVDELSDESRFQAGMMTKQTEAVNMIMKQQQQQQSPSSTTTTKTSLNHSVGGKHDMEMQPVFPQKHTDDPLGTVAADESRKLLLDRYEGATSAELTEQMNHMINERRFSDTLIVHFHGGGFVAQSSKTHEIYLRGWAKEFDVPIFSVDYSLAPEYPYPRGFEECFFAYLWALENAAHLSSSAQRVIVCGDSAGGNMALAVALKAIEMGLRAPDSILAVYPALLIKYAPSPSRILAMMDPILPFGVLTHCLAAYAGLEWMDPTHSWAQKDQQAPSPAASPTKSATASPSIDGDKRYKGLKHEQIMAKRPIPHAAAASQADNTIMLRNSTWLNPKKHPVGLQTIKSAGAEENTSDADESDVPRAALPSSSASAAHISSSQPRMRPSGISRSHSADSALYYDAEDEEASHSLAAATAATADGGGGGVQPTIIRQRSSGSAVNANRDEFMQRRRRAQDAAASASAQNLSNGKRPLTRLYVDGEPQQAGTSTADKREIDDDGKSGSHYADAESDVEQQKHAPLSRQPPPAGGLRRSQSEQRNLPDSYRSRVSDGVTHWRGFDADERKQMEEQQGSRKRLYEDYMQDVRKDYAVSHPTAPWLNMIAPLPRYSFEHVPNDFTLSPLLAPAELLRQLPPTKIVACELDPLLDDAVSFARKMEYEVGNPISLTVVEGMPHGFLHLSMLSKEAEAGNQLCIQTMKDMIKRTPYYAEQQQQRQTQKKPLAAAPPAGGGGKMQKDEMLTVGGDHREKLQKVISRDDSSDTKKDG